MIGTSYRGDYRSQSNPVLNRQFQDQQSLQSPQVRVDTSAPNPSMQAPATWPRDYCHRILLGMNSTEQRNVSMTQAQGHDSGIFDTPTAEQTRKIPIHSTILKRF